MADRNAILSTANELISKDRAETYGSARESFTRIGQLWGIILDRPDIEPHVVALMLVQLKVSRAINAPGHGDSWIDLAGYSALGGELATENFNR